MLKNVNHKIIAEALTINFVPKIYMQYSHDSHVRLKSKEQPCKFQKTEQLSSF